jgi:hypothetical protein
MMCANIYANGEYSWLINDPAFYDKLDILHDDLFVFLMRELSNEEDCVTKQDAELRLTTVINDVTAVLFAVEKVKFITRSDDYV